MYSKNICPCDSSTSTSPSSKKSIKSSDSLETDFEENYKDDQKPEKANDETLQKKKKIKIESSFVEENENGKPTKSNKDDDNKQQQSSSDEADLEKDDFPKKRKNTNEVSQAVSPSKTIRKWQSFPEKNKKVDKSSQTDEDEETIKDIVNKYYLSLTKKLGYLNGQNVNIMHALSEMQGTLDELVRQSIEIANDDPAENDDDEGIKISFPCESYEKFHEFDVKLSTDLSYRKKIKHSLLRSVDNRSSMTRNVGEILRKYLCQDLAINFTTVKAVPGKHVFKTTTFYTCVEEAISKHFSKDGNNPLSQKSFQASVQAVLNNAKDWNGQRNARQKNIKALQK